MGNHRPVTIVLEGSCEEYLEYEQTPSPTIRRAPLHFHSQGDVIEINRLLNQMYQPEKPVRAIFGRDAKARRLISGARSIFFSTPIRNPRLAQHLLPMISPEILQKHLGADFKVPQRSHSSELREATKKLAVSLEDDHWVFLKILYDAAVTIDLSQRWQCRVLFVPTEPLASFLRLDGASGNDLLNAALSQYFLSSRNTRSEALRQMVMRDRMSPANLSSYEEATVYHLIETIRGEFPAFQPHYPEFGDDFGPYTAAQEFLAKSGLTELAFGDSFPAVLRPLHFDAAQHRFFYYSFERPTLIAPVGKKGAGRKFPDNIHGGLNLLRERPDLFDSVTWQFFLSGGKPPGPPETAKSKPHRANLPTEPYDNLLDDFRPIFKDAIKRGWKRDSATGLKQAKWGFMAGLIRISAGEPNPRRQRK
jgi:hypothetical protein